MAFYFSSFFHISLLKLAFLQTSAATCKAFALVKSLETKKNRSYCALNQINVVPVCPQDDSSHLLKIYLIKLFFEKFCWVTLKLVLGVLRLIRLVMQ